MTYSKQLKRLYRELRRFILLVRYKIRFLNCRHTVDDVIDRNDLTLFITNDNGGGTREYEKISTAANNSIVILRRISYGERNDIGYLLSSTSNNKNVFMGIAEVKQVFRHHFPTVIVNTLVHFSETESFLKLLRDYKREFPSTFLLYYVHDYYCICPNPNLFVNDRYCNLECEKNHCIHHVADREIDIKTWRKNWFPFLQSVDRITVFSESSKRILLQSYSFLDPNRIAVIPHDMSWCHNTPISSLDSLPPHIGVIGAVASAFKGKKIVASMIRRYGDRLPITLIGSRYGDFKIRRKKVRYLGPYVRDELQSIVEKNRISMVLFPSLCPETFSYLVSELLMMQIPVLCFDCGAQAEKIRCYQNGTVLKSTDDLWSYLDAIVKVNSMGS